MDPWTKPVCPPNVSLSSQIAKLSRLNNNESDTDASTRSVNPTTTTTAPTSVIIVETEKGGLPLQTRGWIVPWSKISSALNSFGGKDLQHVNHRRPWQGRTRCMKSEER